MSILLVEIGCISRNRACDGSITISHSTPGSPTGRMTDGTANAGERPDANCASPKRFVDSGEGTARQSFGNSLTRTWCIASSGTSTQTIRKSAGTSSRSTLVRYSSSARDGIDEQYAARTPAEFQRPGLSLAPSPSKAAAAYLARQIRQHRTYPIVPYITRPSASSTSRSPADVRLASSGVWPPSDRLGFRSQRTAFSESSNAAIAEAKMRARR